MTSPKDGDPVKTPPPPELPDWLKEAAADWARLQAWARETAHDIRDIVAPSETKFLVLLAVVIGLTTGLFTFFFDKLIHWMFHLGLRDDPVTLAKLPLLSRWKVLFFPAIGGLLVGPTIKYLSPESKGEGVPNVMKAILKQGGRMRGRVAIMKAFLSAASIGTGGSAGREGPIVQIGASIGSRLAQMFRVPAVTLKTMAAAGSAAGIAAAFNAPLGGMAFSLEVILGEITAGPFAMVVLSTVIAAAVSRGLHGHAAFFNIPAYELRHWSELGLYLILGIASGFCAKAFQKLFFKVEHEFERGLPGIDPMWNPAIGGLLVGALGFFIPGVLGPGYETMDFTLNTGYAAGTLVALLAGKMLATALTLGSGGSGGGLMPSLCMGSLLGAFLGQLFQGIFPSIGAAGAYSMVGMAAVFAALIHAPLTAILILFEMTGDYDMILPLMTAVVAAQLAGRVLEPESIYTRKLAMAGIKARPEPETLLLTTTPVGDLMTKSVKTIPADFPVGRLGRQFNKVKLAGFPVVDADGLLVGMITYVETQAAYTHEPPPPPEMPIEKFMRAPGEPLYPDDPASRAVRLMDRHGFDRLPVVSRENPRKLVGIISQKDLLKLYAKRITD